MQACVMANASISVVIAAYGRPERLAACLDGLRSQTHPADEVVVVVHCADEASARCVAQWASGWQELRSVQTDRRSIVASYNRGLSAARGALVAYVDDDAVPAADWLDRIVRTFEQDERIAAVGGRDILVVDGRVDRVRRRCGRRLMGPPAVGRIQWFGRMIGNHHVGVGAPRDVDVLKGVNMSFNRTAVIGDGFDERLRGRGVEMHSELSICLPLRRRGLRVVYDPNIVVMHYAAPRTYGDQRGGVSRDAVFATAHNEALEILDYFGPVRRLLFAVWGLAIGTAESPGMIVLGRDLIERRPAAWARLSAAQRGRAAAWRTRRRRRIGSAASTQTICPRATVRSSD
jgi:cellulose synthase/poly-beta-1,6-N-acetylglucosamine synthase-like glycosyltransferase